MPNDKALRLWDLGYLLHIRRDDAGKLADTDLEFIAAVAQLQTFHEPQYQHYGQAAYARDVVIDGVAGQATDALLEPTNRICGLPDFKPPDGFDFTQITDARIRQAWQSMHEVAEGSAGGWRANCNETEERKYNAKYSVKVHWDDSKFKGPWKAESAKIKDQIRIAVAKYGLLVIWVQSANQANIRFYHQELSGGTIGLAQLPGNNASCAMSIWCTVDSDYTGGNIYARFQLALHEFGHSIDLQHTRSGSGSQPQVMSPYIQPPNGFNGFPDYDYSVQALKAYYGGVPIKLDVDVPPPPKPPTTPKVLATVDVSKVDTIQIVDVNGNDGGGWGI